MKKIVFAVCFVVTAATMQAQSATPESQPASTNIPGAHCPGILPDNRILFGVKAPEAQKVQIELLTKYDRHKGFALSGEFIINNGFVNLYLK